MSFSIVIPAEIIPKGLKLKENEVLDWTQKSLKEQTETEATINVVSELGIKPQAIFKHLKIDLGEIVKKDQVLAEGGFFGGKKKLKSPFEAEVRGINHEDGTITLAVKQTIDVPFFMKAKFVKKDKNGLFFKVNNGVEVPLQNSLDTNFGGQCSYLDSGGEVAIENCEHKVVVIKSPDSMSQAKIAALGPIATVSYESSYYDSTVPLLLLADKSGLKELFAKQWPFCLYLMGKKIAYFYEP